MLRNWKSTLAFFVFVGAYVFTLYEAMDADTIEVSGYIALWSSLFMMFRSQVTVEMLGKLVDTFAEWRKS